MRFVRSDAAWAFDEPHWLRLQGIWVDDALATPVTGVRVTWILRAAVGAVGVVFYALLVLLVAGHFWPIIAAFRGLFTVLCDPPKLTVSGRPTTTVGSPADVVEFR